MENFGLFATAQEAAAAVCEQVSCEAYAVHEIAFSEDGTFGRVTCKMNFNPGSSWNAMS